MCHSGVWISLAVGTVLCVGFGTPEAAAQQRTNIANIGGDSAAEVSQEHVRYVFPRERTITHDSVERKLDYRDINIVRREEAATAAPTAVAAPPAAAEPDAATQAGAAPPSAWWKRPFTWRLRKIPEGETERTVRQERRAPAPTGGATQEHRRYEFPGDRTITHKSVERQLDYERQGISGRPPAELGRPDPTASGEEVVEDWGTASTYGKYRGRRTSSWRELALSGDPDAYDRLIAALQYYPGYDPPNDIKTRRDAAEALGVLRDPRAIPALEDALNDPDFLVRQRAAQALAVLRQYTP